MKAHQLINYPKRISSISYLQQYDQYFIAPHLFIVKANIVLQTTY